jgi:hypothetical protein
MRAAHEAVAKTFKWFIHETSLRNLPSVREIGLQPGPQVPAVDAADDVQAFSVCRNIVCFHPLGSKLIPKSSHEPPLVRLVVSSSDLPARVGIDWSYALCWKKVRDLRKAAPNLSPGEIFVRVVGNCGSIACYEKVDASKLRVESNGTEEDNPGTWPILNTVPNDQVKTYF